MPSATLELLKALVAIDSVNPSLVAGGSGEREIAAFVADWARACGLEANVLERSPGRPSVVVRARSRGAGPSTIHGGEELSSYPARCVVGTERRTLPDETADDVAAELESLLEACRAQDPGLAASQRTLLVREPFETAADEVAARRSHDVVLVPVGVGSLAAAAARFAAGAGVKLIGVEPTTAACLTAALAAGHPIRIPTPGTTMAGLDCAEVSPAAWPSLRDGVHGTITVTDAEAGTAMRELAGCGLAVGECGAAPLAALRTLVGDRECEALRRAVALDPSSRVLLIATEGRTA